MYGAPEEPAALSCMSVHGHAVDGRRIRRVWNVAILSQSEEGAAAKNVVFE